MLVDLAQLQGAIDHMAAFGRDVDECLSDVDQAMAALRRSWDGSGSDAQAQSQQQWQDGAEQMKEALATLQKIAEGARKNYQDAVDKNGMMWG